MLPIILNDSANKMYFKKIAMLIKSLENNRLIINTLKKSKKINKKILIANIMIANLNIIFFLSKNLSSETNFGRKYIAIGEKSNKL